jgi:hypothetical protein
MSRYKYDPLPTASSIRLLQLAPSPDGKTVYRSLKSYELKDAPPYQALSYTWGFPFTLIPKSISAILQTRQALSRARARAPSLLSTDAASTDEKRVQLSGRIKRHSIICDGQIIKVTSNLRDALRMLMASIISDKIHSAPRYYWIDALCMNQQDISERNVQVARMADIFTEAQGVIAWLGKEDEFTADAMATMNRISSISEEKWASVPYTSFYQAGSAPHDVLPSLTFYNWLGFIAMVNRPWFKRAWVSFFQSRIYTGLLFPKVVQEIALAKSASIVCGKYVLPWHKLSQTLSFIRTTKWYHHLKTDKLRHIKALQKSPGIYNHVLQAKLKVGMAPLYLDLTRYKISAARRLNTQERKPSLFYLLETHRFSKSTDPRDKVYGFLGLADRNISPFREDAEVLNPDYNLSVQQVYTETARALLSSHGNLNLLQHVQDPSQTRIPNLPSWVPDYTCELNPYPLRFRGPTLWRSSGYLPWKMNVFSLAQGLLDVQGYMLGRVDQTAVLSHEFEDPSASWASIVKLALSLELPYPNPVKKRQEPSRIEVLWRTLATNIYNKTYPAPLAAGSLFVDYILNLQIRHRLMPWSSADEFQPHHSPRSESIYPEWNTLLQLEPKDSPYCLSKYKERLGTVVESMFNGTYSPIELAQLQHEFDQGGSKKRRLFRTSSNHLGTGPRSLGIGDEVWILNGGCVPFVLRPQSHGNYKLIGEAYVHGVMHGEVKAMEIPRRHITIE